MQGKIEFKSFKKETLRIDGQWFNADKVWETGQFLREGQLVDYQLDDFKNIVTILPIKEVNQDEIILRENVLRTAVMWSEIKKEDIPNMNLNGLFGIAALMEKGIKNGFDKVIE